MSEKEGVATKVMKGAKDREKKTKEQCVGKLETEIGTLLLAFLTCCTSCT